jgi:hypothetical protein
MRQRVDAGIQVAIRGAPLAADERFLVGMPDRAVTK